MGSTHWVPCDLPSTDTVKLVTECKGILGMIDMRPPLQPTSIDNEIESLSSRGPAAEGEAPIYF